MGWWRLLVAIVLRRSPEELETELDLAAVRGGGSYGAGGAGDAGYVFCRRRSEDDEVGGVEIGAIEQVEKLGAELQGEAFAELGVLEDAEVPCGEVGADISVAAEISGEAAGGWRSDEGCGIEILVRIAGDDFAGEIGIEEGTHGVARVAGIRGVIAELRCDREAGLGGDDAGDGPAADQAAGPAFVAAAELAAAAEGEFIDEIDDADVTDVEGGESFVGGEIERIRNETRCIVGGGLVYGVAVVEGFGEGVGAAQGQAVAEAAANVDLQGVAGQITPWDSLASTPTNSW